MRAKEEKPKGIEHTFREINEILGQMEDAASRATMTTQAMADAFTAFRNLHSP